MVVYKITNTINNKIYIGLTTQSVERRWIQHKCYAKKNVNTPLYNALRMYGFDAFTIEVLYTGESLEDIQGMEQKLILQLGSQVKLGKGYNVSYGGESGKMPLDIIEIVRKKCTGKKRTLEQKLAIGTGRMGKGLYNDAARKHPKEKVMQAITLLNDGLTQCRIAEITGLSQSYISNLNTQRRGKALIGA